MVSKSGSNRVSVESSIPLQLDRVSKSFGGIQALKPLTLTVNAGEILALLGPSGCGKTTTLRIIAGFEMPDTGSVLIGGRDVTDLSPNKRALGMVFQNYSLFPHMTVGENIAFGLKMRGIDPDARAKRVRAMLDMVRLGHFEDRTIHQLSGGQQQRVALARSLVTDPALLLLDEPLGALDKHLRESMQFELREIQKRFGITSILVTHDQEEALTMSDRIAVMAAGEIVQVGTPVDIYERPRTRFVSEFLGTANIFDGIVMGQDGAGRWKFRSLGNAEGVLTSAETLAVGQKIVVAVRPERLAIVSGVEGLSAVVKDVVFRGSYYAYELLLGGKEKPFFLYSQAQVPIPENGQVKLSWAPENAILLRDDVAP